MKPMKNNITITYNEIRKIRNRVHKKSYNKKKWIHENFINEITIMSEILWIRWIQLIWKRFINKLKREIWNQPKTTDWVSSQETFDLEKPFDYE